MERAKLIKVGVSTAAILAAVVILVLQFSGPKAGEVIVKDASKSPAPTQDASKSAKTPPKPAPREGGGRLAPGAGG